MIVISDEDYEKALKNNDNLMIMHSAGSHFLNVLESDELYRCKLTALWEALKAWNPDGGRKFTAFLYQRVRWECLKSVNYQMKHKNVQIDGLDQAAMPETSISELLDGLSTELQDIVEKRCIHRMTLREIGDTYGYCYETIRKRLKQAAQRMDTRVI